MALGRAGVPRGILKPWLRFEQLKRHHRRRHHHIAVLKNKDIQTLHTFAYSVVLSIISAFDSHYEVLVFFLGVYESCPTAAVAATRGSCDFSLGVHPGAGVPGAGGGGCLRLALAVLLILFLRCCQFGCPPLFRRFFNPPPPPCLCRITCIYYGDDASVFSRNPSCYCSSSLS